MKNEDLHENQGASTTETTPSKKEMSGPKVDLGRRLLSRQRELASNSTDAASKNRSAAIQQGATANFAALKKRRTKEGGDDSANIARSTDNQRGSGNSENTSETSRGGESSDRKSNEGFSRRNSEDGGGSTHDRRQEFKNDRNFESQPRRERPYGHRNHDDMVKKVLVENKDWMEQKQKWNDAEKSNRQNEATPSSAPRFEPRNNFSSQNENQRGSKYGQWQNRQNGSGSFAPRRDLNSRPPFGNNRNSGWQPRNSEGQRAFPRNNFQDGGQQPQEGRQFNNSFQQRRPPYQGQNQSGGNRYPSAYQQSNGRQQQSNSFRGGGGRQFNSYSGPGNAGGRGGSDYNRGPRPFSGSNGVNARPQYSDSRSPHGGRNGSGLPLYNQRDPFQQRRFSGPPSPFQNNRPSYDRPRPPFRSGGGGAPYSSQRPSSAPGQFRRFSRGASDAAHAAPPTLGQDFKRNFKAGQSKKKRKGFGSQDIKSGKKGKRLVGGGFLPSNEDHSVNTEEMKVLPSFSIEMSLAQNSTIGKVVELKAPVKTEYSQMSRHQGVFVRKVPIIGNMTVEDVAHAMSAKAAAVVAYFESIGKSGIKRTTKLDVCEIELVVRDFGHEAVLQADEASDSYAETLNDIGAAQYLESVAEGSSPHQIERAPMVSVMGHVDHGKTSLLDCLRNSSIADNEAGNITQKIGASQYVRQEDGRKVVFVDTPGHEAFSSTRKVGATVSDIVLLIVAADDGVQQQTIEVAKNIKQFEKQAILVITKIDRLRDDEIAVATKAISEKLLSYDIIVEQYGGATPICLISSKTKAGVNSLIDSILLQADVMGLPARDYGPAKCIVVDSGLLDKSGIFATVVVTNGILKIGDSLLASTGICKVRRMIVAGTSQSVSEAGPGTPVIVFGFDSIIEYGARGFVIPDHAMANKLLIARKGKEDRDQAEIGNASTRVVAMDWFKKPSSETKQIRVIVKCDNLHSASALKTLISGVNVQDVNVSLHKIDIGNITESDVDDAKASKALLYGFNTKIDSSILSDISHVKIYSVIYNLIDDIILQAKTLAGPIEQRKIIGKGVVIKVFDIKKVGRIAGTSVNSGIIRKKENIAVYRESEKLFEGPINSLKRVDKHIDEATTGQECGILVSGFDKFEVGDIIEAYSTFSEDLI